MKTKVCLAVLCAFLSIAGCAFLQPVPEPSPPIPEAVPAPEEPIDLTRLAEGTAANKIRAFTGLTGGTTGKLDKVSESVLDTNDLALVFSVTDETMYFYYYDGTSTDVEVSPERIRPDDYSSAGVWILMSAFRFGPSSTPQTVYRDDEANNGGGASLDWDDIAYWTVNCTDTGTGSEDCDIALYISVAGAATKVFNIDADGSIVLGGTTSLITKTRIDLQMLVVDFATDVATGDGEFYIPITPEQDGKDLVYVHAQVITAGTTGTTDIQLTRCDAVGSGNACSGTTQDMLSTKLTIDSGEDSSDTAATAAVINSSYDDVDENEVIRVDIDSVSTTAPKGLIITLGFQDSQPGSP